MFEQLPGKLRALDRSAPQPQNKRSAPPQLPAGQSQTPQRASEISERSQHVSNSTHRSQRSPNQHGSLKRPSITQESPSLRDQMSVDQNYRGSSRNSYSASNNSPSTSLASSMAPHGTENNYVPDLSSMMFPSADPFAYPNQPMTTLENRQPIKQENPVDPSIFGPPNSSGAPYNNLSYGSLPYMMQNQQLGYGMQNMDAMSNTEPTSTTMPPQRNEGGGWAQQQQQQRSGGTTGMNYDQLFGEDWGGWMNQGYRQDP